MIRVNRVDRGQLGGVTKTPQGYLRIDDSVATRTGVLEYRNPDGSIRRELRHPDEVGKAESLRTLAAVPVTDLHPPEMLTAANTRQYGRGYTGESVAMDGGLVKVAVTITDAELITDVDANRKRELSCGYTCDLVMEPGEYNGERYDARQTNIVYNHLAVVPRGRAGPVASLKLDAAEQVSPDDPGEGEPKPMPKINIDGVEVEVSESAAVAINAKLRADAQAIEAEKKAVEQARKDATEAQTKADKEAARADAAEEKLKERTDAPDVSSLVKARLDLVSKAMKVLPADQHTKLDAMSDAELKVAVIKQVSPTVNLDGKSEAYVDARFDAALETAGDRHDHTGALRAGATPAPAASPAGAGGEQRVDHDEARRKMVEESRNAWKEAK